MKTAVISVSLFHSKILENRFLIDSETKEYEIADRAFRLAIMLAKIKATAEYGPEFSDYELGKWLNKIEYNYHIEEIDEE